MSRWIDADALECDTEWSEYHDGFISYSQLEIDTAPSIEIVRCKECKHYFYDELNDCKMCYVHEYGEIWEDDDFCSYGERREP